MIIALYLLLRNVDKIKYTKWRSYFSFMRGEKSANSELFKDFFNEAEMEKNKSVGVLYFIIVPNTKSLFFMKIKYTLAGLLVILAISAVCKAQTLHPIKNEKNTKAKVTAARQRIDALLQYQNSRNTVAAKTTTTLERLVATSSYDYLSTTFPTPLTDSTSYTYSGSRGSNFNRDVVGFIQPNGGFFTSGLMPLLIASGYTHTTLNGVFSFNLSPDTVTYWSNVMIASGVYVIAPTGGDRNTYNTAGKIVDCINQSYPAATGIGFHYINTFNTSNQITCNLEIQWNGFSWDTISNTYFFYNAGGSLILDSFNYWSAPGVWDKAVKNTYTYSAANNLIFSEELDYAPSTGTWDPATRFYLTYNTDNTIHTDSGSSNSSGYWEPTIRDSFGYTSGANYWTFKEMKIFPDSIAQKDIMIKHVNSFGLPDTVTEIKLGKTATGTYQYLSKSKNEFHYNTIGDPYFFDRFVCTISDSTTGAGTYHATPDYRGNYYYYRFPGAVTIPPYTQNIKIFPNPSSGKISILKPGITPGTYTSIQIMNATGQILRLETLPFLHETETISIEDFAPGIYYLVLSDASGTLLTTQKIVKQ